MPTTVHQRVALALVLTYVVVASAYALIVPSWEAPDEPAHFAFIRDVIEAHQLPIDHTGALGEEHQPPLYYLLAGLATLPANLGSTVGGFRANSHFLWAGHGGTEINAAIHSSDETFPFRDQALGLHLAREVSVLLGVGTVVVTLVLGWELFPQLPLVGLLAASFVAFDPQFLFISGEVSNDNLLTLLATISCWRMVRLLKRPREVRQWAFLGLWIALATLAKLSGLSLGLVAGVILVWTSVRERSVVFFFRRAGAFLLGFLPLVSWWFARNIVLYRNLIGWKMDPQNERFRPLLFSDYLTLAREQFQSFWGLFGWMDVPAPRWFDIATLVLVVICFSGLLWGTTRGRFRTLTGFQKSALAVLGFEAIVSELAIVGIVVDGCDATCYQGRLLFPAIAPLMLFLAIGMVSILPSRWTSSLSAGAAIALALTSAYMLVGVIRPAYDITPLPRWYLWIVPNPVSVTFGQTFQLRGYDVGLDSGERHLQVSLFWRAARKPDFDYSVSAHVIDGAGKLVAQEDQAPGANQSDPPTDWLTGDVIADVHSISLPANLPDGTYHLVVGVYNWRNSQILPLDNAPTFKPNSLVLSTVVLQHQHWIVQGSRPPVSKLEAVLSSFVLHQ